LRVGKVVEGVVTRRTVDNGSMEVHTVTR
jgi:hypothetical protein